MIRRKIFSILFFSLLLIIFLFYYPFYLNNYTKIVKTDSPKQKDDVVLYLVPKIESDLNNLLQSLKSLNNLRNWSFKIIIFHSGDLTPCIQSYISQNGPIGRKIVFYEVELAVFPPYFKPTLEIPFWNPEEFARDPWGYYHMIHFWFKRVFHLPIMKSVRYYLRLDTDSVIVKEPDISVNLFNYMKEKKLVYLGNDYNIDCNYVVYGLRELYTTFTYTVRGNWTNQTLWKKQQDHEKYCNCDCVWGFYNNFEMGDVDFFLREDVLSWTDYVDRANGIYEYRWGDAVLRFLTIGMFATEQQIDQRSSNMTKVEYSHGKLSYVSKDKYDINLKKLLDSNC